MGMKARPGTRVEKRDTRYASRTAFVKALYNAMRGKGLSHVASICYVAFAAKAQRGWLPNGKLWNFNFWGVKATPSYISAGGKYFSAYGRERDKKTGEYQDKVEMRWRAFDNPSQAVADHLKRMRGSRYRTAHAYVTGMSSISQEQCVAWARLLYTGGYFTAAPDGWGKDVYANTVWVQKELKS